MSDLADLKRRVEEATGPDRELDAAIMFDLFAKPVGSKPDGGPSGYLWPEDNPSWNFGLRFPGKDRAWFARTRVRGDDEETLLIERDGALVLVNSLRVPRLTASLDATVALIERVMPGFARHVAYIPNIPTRKTDAEARLWLPAQQTRGWKKETFSGDGKTEPLALLAALLSACEGGAK